MWSVFNTVDVRTQFLYFVLSGFGSVLEYMALQWDGTGFESYV